MRLRAREGAWLSPRSRTGALHAWYEGVGVILCRKETATEVHDDGFFDGHCEPFFSFSCALLDHFICT